jgi:hypothetical protein
MKLDVQILKEPALGFGNGVQGISPKDDMPKGCLFGRGKVAMESPKLLLG